jgi:hypothetical protein
MAYPVSRFKKDDKKEKKMILAIGLLIAVVLAVAGTQMSVSGREYTRKVKLLEARGYELDETLAWSDIDEWEESIKIKYKNDVRIERKEIEDWTEFYGIYRDSLSTPVYDYSLYDSIHGCGEEYVIWFSTVYLRGSRQGRFITFYIYPDG